MNSKLNKLLLSLIATGMYGISLGKYVLTPGYPSGGTIMPGKVSYKAVPAGYGGRGTSESGLTACSGTITYQWTWTGTAPPPPFLLVKITSSAGFTGGSGDCDDGIDETDDTPPSGSADETTYDVISAPGSTVTETISPSAEARGGMYQRRQLIAQSSVAVNMSVSPCEIVFTDSNGVGPSGARQYMIGQNVRATLSVSAPVTNQKWSATGGGPFQSYSVSQDSGVLTPLPNSVLGQGFSGYFAAPSRPTLTCSFEVAGTQCEVSQSFTTNAPVFAVFKQQSGTQGGYPAINPTGLYTFGDSYTDTLLGKLTVGVDFGADLTSAGRFQYVQLTNMARTRSAPSQTLEMPWPPGSRRSFVTSGLDTIYPSFPTPSEEPSGYFPSGNYFYDYDSPLQTFEPGGFSNYTIDGESFVTTLLYLPPGGSSMNVPVESWNWSWGCSGASKKGTWFAPDSAMPSPTAATAYGNFPTWSNYVSGANAIWR